jgi:flagellar hook assembly protein FlgD
MADTWILDWGALTAVSEAPGRDAGAVTSTPNPARGATTIRFDVPRRGTVSLRVYDWNGRLVRRLVDGPLRSGAHAVHWDLETERGRELAAGTYFYELRAGGVRRGGRVLIIR